MFGLDDAVSRAMHAGILEHRFPQIKKQLYDGEELLAVSGRKPLRSTGLFCVAIGAFLIWQLSTFFLGSAPQWAIPTLFVSVMIIWVGFWLAVLAKNEYVFLTNNRVVHMRADLFGRLTRKPTMIPLLEIKGVRLYKKSNMFRSSNNETGDIIIRKDSKSYLTPTVFDSVNLSETLMVELRRLKAQQQQKENILSETD